jgi:hypothetical protein
MTNAEINYTMFESVKLLRGLLRKQFRPTTLRVSYRFHSVPVGPDGRPHFVLRVEWFDGPTVEQVQPVVSTAMHHVSRSASVTLMTVRSPRADAMR